MKLSNSTNRKFVEEFDVSEWEIETDGGWEAITSSKKTVEYEVWQIKTKSHSLKCADDHILFDEHLNETFVKDCIAGKSYIQTKLGLQKVISVNSLQYSENMYDLTVDSENHRYYTNGILSHNTSVVIGYLLWFILFNSEKRVGILANKKKNSTKALGRLCKAYQYLPMWLQQGITTWNKGDIELENGSVVETYAASSDAARGESFAFLFVDECCGFDSLLTIKDKITKEIKVLKIGDLYNELNIEENVKRKLKCLCIN